jgi:hypothetical protein
MDVVRETTEFMIGKIEGDYRYGLCQVEWSCLLQEKERDFCFKMFFISSLTWRWGETYVTLHLQ